jgi:hypothetical protein
MIGRAIEVAEGKEVGRRAFGADAELYTVL